MVDDKSATLTKGFAALILATVVSLAAGAAMLAIAGFAAHLGWVCLMAGWDASLFGT